MSETISMTDILLTVSVGCNLWFLFLLLYDRIMETRLVGRQYNLIEMYVEHIFYRIINDL